jgi:PRTRC genetic system protein E
MIKQLATLLKPGDTVTFTVAIESAGHLRVNIYPRLTNLADDGNRDAVAKALNAPLTLTGTPDDFDSPEFVETLTKFTASIAGLRSSLAESEKTHADAAKAPGGAAKAKAPAPRAVATTKTTLPPRPGLMKTDAGQVAGDKAAITPPPAPVPADAIAATTALI